MVFPMILLLINGDALTIAADMPGFPAPTYRAFWFANTFVFGAMTMATTMGANMARDIETGFLDRLVLTPTRSLAILLGHLGGAVLMAVVICSEYLVVGRLLGVEIATGPTGIAGIYALQLLIAIFFASLGTALALRFETAEAVESIFPLFFALLFLSSGNFPRPMMDAAWFKTVATFNPVTYVIEGIRALVNLEWSDRAVVYGFLMAGLLAGVSLGFAARGARSRMARA
jgi:ABC-2 type transport system permease protein